MTKISDLTALTGAGVDDAADLLTIVDMSEAGAARNKKITIDETRIALGLSSADSPQFTALNLGHASDTTITRVSAGVVAIEGVNIVTTAGGVTFAADIIVPAEAYGVGWNGSNEAPTKNDVYDKIESLSVGGGITVEDEGSSEGTGITTLNFTGAGVSVTVVGSEAEVIVAGGGGGGIDVEDEGVSEATGATTLNFTGAGVTATDAGGGVVDVTIPGGGGASGTSFPGSPSTDDFFYRTDRRIEYFYDGTRWLSTQLFSLPLHQQDALSPYSATLDLRAANPWWNLYGIYVERLVISSHSTTTTASNYFTCRFSSSDGATFTQYGSGISLQNDTQNEWIGHAEAINSVLANSIENLLVRATETGTSSTYINAAITYRLIG